MSSGEKQAAERASGATAKELILERVRALPDDSSYDEILRELAFARMVARGLADADQGRTIDSEELRERVRQWRS
jgi:predicted transcriptional regulator